MADNTLRKVQALQDHLSPVTVACSEESSACVKQQQYFPSAQEGDTSQGALSGFSMFYLSNYLIQTHISERLKT